MVTVDAELMVVATAREPTDEEFLSIALSKGLVLHPIDSYKTELALSIKSRLVQRKGDKFYQAAAYDLPLFPRAAAEAILPAT